MLQNRTELLSKAQNCTVRMISCVKCIYNNIIMKYESYCLIINDTSFNMF